MTRWAARLMTGLLVVAMVGCTVRRHLEAADAAAVSGDLRAAVYHYQRALKADPSLERDRGFMTRLAGAEAHVAYDEAVDLRASGNYEAAIDKLSFALERDSGYAQPKQLLPLVRAEAAGARYAQAVSAADRGDLGAARLHLDKSLQFEPRNEQAALALESLSAHLLPDATPGLAAYKQGVALSSERRWTEAEQVLVVAVGEGPGLLPARAALYEARAELERSRRLTNSGAGQLAERQLGPALDALTLALEVWPYNERAGELLRQAKTQRALAEAKVNEASEAAAQRDWGQAIALSEAGLVIDKSHAGLADLLRQFRGKAAADYADQGDTHLAAKRLLEAQRDYRRAVELDPSLRSAATSLRQTESALNQSLALTGTGETFIGELQMGPAITELNQALDVWPFNEKAQELLGIATREQARAEALYQSAGTLAERAQWDQAVAQADQGLAIDRSHEALGALRAELPTRAAVYYTDQGDQQLTAGQFDAARQSYGQALRYINSYNDALSGVASVYEAQGAALEAKGLPGAALLHYLVGQSYPSEHPVSDAAARVHALVRDRVGMSLSVTVGQGRGGAVGADQVGDAVEGVLASYRPYGLDLAGQGAPYALRLTITGATIDERRIGSVQRTQHYTTTELRHNDEYDHVLAHLRQQEAILDRCAAEHSRVASARDAARHRAANVRAPRRPTQPSKPQLEESRTNRPRRGEQPGEAERLEQERQARNQRRMAEYRRQMAAYERELSEYQRDQREYERHQAEASRYDAECDRLHSALRRQERVVSDCRSRLHNTPHQVRVTFHHDWPYTVETYAKLGRLDVQAELIDTATGRVVERFDHRADFEDQDDQVLNANPEVGVRRDGLSLASDGEVRSVLSGRLAKSAGPWAVDLAVQHRLGVVYAGIEALRKAGKTDLALEAEVDAAVLLGIVDQAGSAKLLGELSEREVE